MKKINVCVLCFILLLGILPVQAYVVTDEGQLPFKDILNTWYTPALTFCYANDIMKGTSDNKFTPQGVTTREQMMTVLANISGEEISGHPQSSFTDVKAGVWYTDYVNWAVSKGITKGISDTLFGIGKALTRQEAVTLMYNYSGFGDEAQADLTVFADNEKVADWARDAFGWAVSVGVITGNSGNLNPRNNITRAELAQVVRAFMEKIVYGSCEHSFTEADCVTSAFCTLCDMVSGLPKGHHCPVLTCTEGSKCINCSEMIFPKGHVYIGADCTQPMTCTVCSTSSGEPVGHTTDNGVCGRCNKELFTDAYAKFAYYMTECAMSDGNVKYLKAEVTHTDGNTSTQYVKYDAAADKGSLEIIFDFAKNNHSIKTVINFSNISSTYNVESCYYVGNDVRYSGMGKVNANNAVLTLESYNGNSTYRSQFEALAKNSLLLSLDASNMLMKTHLNMTASDFGFADFK